MSEIHTLQLNVNQLTPNTYNPNQMAEDEFAELVDEVRLLGRLPKPVVVRQRGDVYEIIDGEHSWRAAQQVGLVEVTVEVVEADDFEAMRQTYKRNQHGRHDRVREGLMFEQMMEAHQLSNRELAKEIGVSEGTVRNSLLYAKADQLRKAYAVPEKDPRPGKHGGPKWVDLDDQEKVRTAYAVEDLSLRQVRTLVALPSTIGQWWLYCWADISVIRNDAATAKRDSAFKSELDCAAETLKTVEESGLVELCEFPWGASTFRQQIMELEEWHDFENQWAIGGISCEQLRRYTRPLFKANLRSWQIECCLEIIIDPGEVGRFCVTPDELQDCLLEYESGHHRIAHLKNLLSLHVRKKGFVPDKEKEVQDQLYELELADAPTWLRESRLDLRDQVDVYTALLDDEGLDEAVVREVIESDVFPTTRHGRVLKSVRLGIERKQKEREEQQRLEEKAQCQATVDELADSIVSRFYTDPGDEPSTTLRKKLATFTYTELLFLDHVVDERERRQQQFARSLSEFAALRRRT